MDTKSSLARRGDLIATKDPVVLTDTELSESVSLDRALTTFRRELAESEGEFSSALIMAKAVGFLKSAITPGMLAEFRSLADTPMGFRTDRPAGSTRKIKKNGEWVQVDNKPYDDDTLKECIIIALMSGAKLTGNQFSILAGNCYLTKNFFKPAIQSYPGLSGLQVEMGVPVRGPNNVAACEAVASWWLGGEHHTLRCAKAGAEGSIDTRIVVNAYDSSSTDEILGRVESKLYRRIFERLRGMGNLLAPDEDPPATQVAIEKPKAIESQVEADSPAADPDELELAMTFAEEFGESIRGMDSISDVSDALENRVKLLDAGCEWSDDIRRRCVVNMSARAEKRLKAIRGSRGEKSNQPA
jgi:hypothetical protein